MNFIKKFFCFFLSFLHSILQKLKWPKLNNSSIKNKYETAIFAMGCFWCGEAEFRSHETLKPLHGIISIRVGFAGGTMKNPTYKNHKGYKEAVKIVYDPKKISYSRLLDIFWRNIDPFDNKGQFCDKGFSYTAAVFYQSKKQHQEALKTFNIQQKKFSSQKIVTELIPHTTFTDAEEYHQNYQKKNPLQYKYYKWSCGREKRLKEVWKEKDI